MSGFYGISETVKNAWSLVCTKLFFPSARLVRRPIYLRGKQGLSYGPGFSTGYRCRIEIIGADQGKKLFLGQNCRIGDGVHIVASERVSVGDDCLMASNIFISDTDHGSGDSPLIPPDQRPLRASPVVLGNKIWLGESVCVLPGAHIGDGCIIGAHSVVKGEIPPYTVAVGVPARPVKRYNFQTERWESIK